MVKWLETYSFRCKLFSTLFDKKLEFNKFTFYITEYEIKQKSVKIYNNNSIKLKNQSLS